MTPWALAAALLVPSGAAFAASGGSPSGPAEPDGVLADASLSAPRAAEDSCGAFLARRDAQARDVVYLSRLAQAQYAPDLGGRKAAARRTLQSLGVTADAKGLALARELTAGSSVCQWAGYDLLGLLRRAGASDAESENILLGAMKDRHDGTRRLAARAAGGAPGPRVIEALFDAFKNDAEPDGRENAACVLAVTGGLTRAQRAKLEPRFKSVAGDAKADAATRELARKALGSLTGRDRDFAFQQGCVWLPSEAFQPCDDFAGRYRGRWDSGGTAFRNSLTRSLDIAFNSPDHHERAAAASVIIKAVEVPEDERGLSVARLLTYAADPWCQGWGYQLLSYLDLAQIRDETSKQDMALGLQKPQPSVRTQAVMALGAYSDEDLIPLIFRAFRSDPDPGVRERAACSLSHTGLYTKDQRKRMVPLFLKHLEDESLDRQTRDWAAQALHYLTGQTHGRNVSEWRRYVQAASP